MGSKNGKTIQIPILELSEMPKEKHNSSSNIALKNFLMWGLLLRVTVPGIIAMALIIILIFCFAIPLFEDNMLQGRKDTARELTSTVLALLQSYADQVPEEATQLEAQEAAIKHIRNLRYGPEDKDYFWINDMHPTMIMHPFRTELEGTDLTDFQDVNGINLFVEFQQTVITKGSGFVEYSWWWKDSERVEDKISFVKGFAPWGWIVGTGLYIDDVKAEISLLKNRAIFASCIFVALVAMLVTFMIRQRFLAEKNQVIAEFTLRQSEQKFRGLFNNSNHFAGILDNDGNLLDVNAIALAAIRQPREAVIGQPFKETLFWKGSPESQLALTTLLQECRNGLVSTDEVEHHLPNNKTASFVYSAIPIFDETGNVDRMLLEGWDITQRRMLEDQLRQSQKMEAIGQLAGGIAHDFNNLLSGIIGNATLLYDFCGLKGEDLESVEQILVASNRSADLIRQLMSFSRKGQLQNVPVDLHKIIEEVTTLLGRSIDRDILITKTLKSNCPFVKGDPSLLQNALLNLGVNARDSMDKIPKNSGIKCEINFSTSEVFLDGQTATRLGDNLNAGWHVQVCVSDTGCGIKPKIIERIFEPFFTTKDKGKGTGLGLAGVYGCVQTHHGSITVRSELNVGTSFKLLLPRSTENLEESPKDVTHISATGGKILFIDDDEVLRTTMARVLTRLGYDPAVCSDGSEGVTYYTQNFETIDLVILDLIMPKMGGEEAFHHLMAINPNARIIVSSGFSHNLSVDALISQGACGFLAKPFQISELSQTIATHIHGGKMA